MSETAISAPPVLVDVAVVLTAVIRSEPEAGGYSASIPRSQAVTRRARPLRKCVRTSARLPKAGWPSRTTTLLPARQQRKASEDRLR